MADDLTIFDIDPEKEEQELRAYFTDELTHKPLYAGQCEAAMISLISYQSSVNKIKYAESLKMCLLRYAKGIWLDLYGEFWHCPRIKATPAEDVLQVKLFDVFEVDKILPKDSEIETKDGLYVFKTLEDLIIPAGQMYGTVKIESELAGAALNDYAAGDINSLVKNYEYIESVTNLNGASGGSDPEEDDDYRERLFLAPEKLSTAGTETGYKYLAMSAHKDIIDVSVDLPQEPASVTIGESVYVENGGVFDDEAVTGTVNYKTGVMELTFAEPVSAVKIRIEPAATVELRILTKDGEASSAILGAVDETLSPYDKRPMTDNVLSYSASKVNFTVSGKVIIERNANYETVCEAIDTALAKYFELVRSQLECDVLLSDIIKVIKLVEGVYDVELTSPTASLKGSKKIFYNGLKGDLNIVRRAANGFFASKSNAG